MPLSQPPQCWSLRLVYFSFCLFTLCSCCFFLLSFYLLSFCLSLISRIVHKLIYNAGLSLRYPSRASSSLWTIYWVAASHRVFHHGKLQTVGRRHASIRFQSYSASSSSHVNFCSFSLFIIFLAFFAVVVIVVVVGYTFVM